MNIQIVGVIGAGVIGAGVAQDLAQTGHRVILLDLSEAILERSREAIKQGIRFKGFFKQVKQTESAEEVLARITFSTSPAELREADFIIENVTEKLEVKREVYTALDSICPEDTVFAANTSAVPITHIASLTKRPARVIGIHFMNPVPLKPLVEVIRGYHTSDETLAEAKKLLTQMGKDCIVVGDSPGFVSNRILMLTINEAIFLIHERVASAGDVDRIFMTCFGHKMGPLATADLIGLDTVLFSMDVLYASFNDSKYRPCPLLKSMVDAGLHGRKSGRGFYTYDQAS
jgi:3-hydroxybutyryl-CoA dehydrogenase